LGSSAVEAAFKAARGESIEKRIVIGATLVTKENAKDFLK
jgi:ABC-type sugar transport system substrate-binding protein